ncbi:conserved hypothetical protein [Luminiphilus syltensis NOR5-1B]|uniref:SnoaL-like domain-containing protein n=1 Tax=Luminiphilus syltensis NOR5-1B TaxID=565045 RepID=B8KSA2_9GAMM|nr:hypothetical protein [Luminiphilus syltensis]EED35477.1 conserved hypothetical protein [Luminiphilus syltensis NOR5-1B]
MTSHAVIQRWHEIVAAKDPSKLHDWLAEDCCFWSPVIHTPQQGRAITMFYLSAAFGVLGPKLRYVREWVGPSDAVLEFETQVDDVIVNGVDMIHWNEAGLVTEFKVMIRPLKAIGVVQEKMATMLAQSRELSGVG